MFVVRDMSTPMSPSPAQTVFWLVLRYCCSVLAAMSDPHKRHSNLTTINTMKGRKGLEMVISSFMIKVSLLWKVSHPHVHSKQKRFTSNQNSCQSPQSCILAAFMHDLHKDIWENTYTHTGCIPCTHWPVTLTVRLLTCRLFPSRGRVFSRRWASSHSSWSFSPHNIQHLLLLPCCLFWSSCRPAKELERALEALAGRGEVGWKRKGHLGVEREEQVWDEAVIASKYLIPAHNTKQTKL